MLGLGLGVDKIRPSGGVDPAITALLAQAATDGYTAASGSTLTALDTYVKGLKADGIWDKLDLLYVFATNGDSDFATYNLKDPANFQATKVNAPTFTSLEGFTGDAATSYLNTNFTPSTDATNYTLNSASYGVYSRTDKQQNNIFEMGARTAPNDNASILGLNYLSAGLFADINGSSLAEVYEPANTLGLFHINRDAVASWGVYQNGTIQASETGTSDDLPTFPFFVSAINNGGSPNLYSDRQLSIAFAGADLSVEAGDFFTRTEAYMDALGKGVV